MPESGAGGDEDALSVSLHDAELAQEVELTARLMVAANESHEHLADETVDDILGVDDEDATPHPPMPPLLPPPQRRGHD